MKLNRIHRLLGIILLCPMLAWAVTGLIFFVKPGYSGAYEMLSLKTYPLAAAGNVFPQSSWLEYRYFRTVLGEHLMARTAAGWQHLDPHTLQTKPAPTDAEVGRLVADALSANPQRYGQIVSVGDNTVRTSTGVEIRLDWQQMGLQQHGRDTDFIDGLYRVHYLQWTGVPAIDKVLGMAGLALLMGLTILGAKLAFGGTTSRK
jgi:hypothetical protein